MQYTTQIQGSPYQIHPGEAFSAYVRRMDDACGGSFLADYAEERPDVVDILGTVESAILRDLLWSEMTEGRRAYFCDSADFASQTEAYEDADNPDPDADPDAYYRVLIRLGCDDPLTRANLLGLAENHAPGVLARVAARLRGA